MSVVVLVQKLKLKTMKVGFPDDGCFVAVNSHDPKRPFLAVQSRNGRQLILISLNARIICKKLDQLYKDTNRKNSNPIKAKFHNYFQNLIEFMYRICNECEYFTTDNPLCREFMNVYRLRNYSLHLKYYNDKWNQRSNVDHDNTNCNSNDTKTFPAKYVLNNKEKQLFATFCGALVDIGALKAAKISRMDVIDDYLDIMKQIWKDDIVIDKTKLTPKKWCNMINSYQNNTAKNQTIYVNASECG